MFTYFLLYVSILTVSCWHGLYLSGLENIWPLQIWAGNWPIDGFPLSKGNHCWCIFGWWFVSTTHKITHSYAQETVPACQNWFHQHLFTLRTIKVYDLYCFNLIYSVTNMVWRWFCVCERHSGNKTEQNFTQIGHSISRRKGKS